MTDLQRVLAALDKSPGIPGVNETYADAARVLRELAADFDLHARHEPGCEAHLGLHSDGMCLCDESGCVCGLDAAKGKWRLEP